MGEFKDLDIRLQEQFPNGYPEPGPCQDCNGNMKPVRLVPVEATNYNWEIVFECQTCLRTETLNRTDTQADTDLLTEAMEALDAALFEQYDNELTERLLSTHRKLRQRLFGQTQP